MTAKNHVATTLSVVLMPMLADIQFLYNNVFVVSVFLAGVIFGSLLPDIDESNSYIGSKVAIFSSLANSAIGHRTITHNVFVWIIIGLYGYFSGVMFVVGLSIGAILHILEDSATNSGAKWAFKPLYSSFALLPKRFRFKTNGAFENYVYTPIITLVFVVEIAYLLLYSLHIIEINIRG